MKLSDITSQQPRTKMLLYVSELPSTLVALLELLVLPNEQMPPWKEKAVELIWKTAVVILASAITAGRLDREDRLSKRYSKGNMRRHIPGHWSTFGNTRWDLRNYREALQPVYQVFITDFSPFYGNRSETVFSVGPLRSIPQYVRITW